MSPEQEPTMARLSSTTGRWSQYTSLSRQIKQAGLLDRRRGWYAARIGLNLALLAGGWVAFAILRESWWQLVIAAYLAVVFTQVAFVGHDAGHRQIFRSRRANDLVGLLHANLGVGVSFDWWVGKHNRHHSNPNHEDLDPDISITALAFTADQASSKHGLVRLIARHQGWLFFPLLLLEAAHLHLASIKAVLRGSGRASTIEGLLLLAHVAGYLMALVLVVSPLQAVVFVVVQQGLFGLYLGCSFAPNHKGMPTSPGARSAGRCHRRGHHHRLRRLPDRSAADRCPRRAGRVRPGPAGPAGAGRRDRRARPGGSRPPAPPRQRRRAMSRPGAFSACPRLPSN
jgi:fatty acid desaturase